MGLFRKRVKTYVECNRECEEAEGRSCDECMNSVNCKKEYGSQNREDCWKCRYKMKKGNQCILRME